MKNNKLLFKLPRVYPVRHDLQNHPRSFRKVDDLSTMLQFDLEELSLLVEFDSGVVSVEGMPQVVSFKTSRGGKP